MQNCNLLSGQFILWMKRDPFNEGGVYPQGTLFPNERAENRLCKHIRSL